MNNEGFFSKLLKGIVSPAARLSVAQQKFSNKLFGGTGQIEDQMARSILGNQKYQAVQQNPLTEGLLKPLASGASYGVQAALAPIKGAGLLANAGRLGRSGAVAGGLAGLGESAQGNELNSIGSGASTGAVLNLLTGGLFKKQNLKADGIMGQLDDITVKNVFKGTTPNQLKINEVDPKEFNRLAVDVINKAKEITGKSTIDATDVYNAKNDIVNGAATEIEKFAGKVIKDGKVSIGKQIAPLLEKKIGTYDKLFGNDGDDVAKEALDIYKGMSNNPTVGEIRAFWQKLIEAQGGFDKAVRGAGRGNNELNLLKRLSEIARKSIETGGPEVSQAMKKYSTVNELLDVFTKNYPKTQSSGLGNNLAGNLLGDVVNVTSSKAKGSQALAKLFNVGGMNEGASLLNKVAAPIAGGFTGGIGQDTSTVPAQDVPQTEVYQYSDPQSQQNLYTYLMQAAKLLPKGTAAQQLELAQTMIKQSETAALDLPTVAKNKLADADAAQVALGEIEAALDESEKSFGIFGELLAKNPLDTKRGSINSKLSIGAQVIGKFLEGGKLTDADIQRYKDKVLPVLGQTPEQARARIENLKRQLEAQKLSIIKNYAGSSGGSLYDILGSEGLQ